MGQERERENGSRIVASRALTLARVWGVVKCLPLLVLGFGACSSEYQDVTIVIDDFRFTPAQVDVQAGQPLHLVVRNQGRETHRFQTTFSAQPRIQVVSEASPQADSLEQGMPLAPGQSLALNLTLPPGVYHFRCPIKGHRGMQGTIVVHASAQT